MNKIITFLAVLLLGSTLINPLAVNATAGESSGILSDGTVMVTEISKNELEIVNIEEGTVDTVKYIDNHTAKLAEEDGTVHNITFDAEGNAYDNGVLVSEVEVLEENLTQIEKPEKVAPPKLTRGYNGPWLSTGYRYTKRSFYSVSQSVAITIVGFVPGFGYIAGAAAIVHAIWSYNQKEIYYKLSYFVDTSYAWQKTNCSAYRYSNYTGHLGTTYGSALRIHW